MSTTVLESGQVREEVRALIPTIEARAREVDEARRVPPDLVDDLVAAGCFRMMVPRSHGGLEMELPDVLAVVADLARADGSVAWTVAIGTEAALVLGHLPRPAFFEGREYYSRVVQYSTPHILEETRWLRDPDLAWGHFDNMRAGQFVGRTAKHARRSVRHDFGPLRALPDGRDPSRSRAELPPAPGRVFARDRRLIGRRNLRVQYRVALSG